MMNTTNTTLNNINQINSSLGNLANTLNDINAQHKQDENIEWQKNQITNEFDFQKYWADKQFEYQKMMNNLTMSREDNAIQRRAADLAAAGLNPNLAVGQPASSQGFGGAGSVGVVGTNLGQRHVAKLNQDAGAYLDARMRMAQLGQTYAQNELLDSQRQYYESLAGKVDAETATIPDTQNYLRANTSLSSGRLRQLEHDLNINVERHIRSNDNGNYALIQQVLNSLKTRLSSKEPLINIDSINPSAGIKNLVDSVRLALSDFSVSVPHIAFSLEQTISKFKDFLIDYGLIERSPHFPKDFQELIDMWKDVIKDFQDRALKKFSK